MDCYIYGAGQMYNRIVSRIRLHNELNILGVVTTDIPQYDRIDSYKRYSALEVEWNAADYVIIAVEDWKPIYKILSSYGVPEDRVINGKIFELPYFEFSDYITLKNSRPSIISNTCLGGRVYKELAVKMYSPFINLAAESDESYISFLKEFRESNVLEIQPYLPQEDPTYSGIYNNRKVFINKAIVDGKYPLLIPHDDLDVCIHNWKKRRTRLNYTNLSVLMIAFSDNGAYEFEELNYDRKICFYYKDLGLKSLVYTPEWNNREIQMQFDYNYQMFVHRYATNIEGHGRVNWINFLLGKDEYLRW